MPNDVRSGWSAWLSRASLASLAFLTVSGLAVTLGPFHAAVEWSVLVHTAVGLATLVPLTWYFAVHWLDYRRYRLSDSVLLGYVAVAALLVCSLSGVVVTWQGLLGIRTSPLWRDVHLYSTLAALGAGLPHVLLVYVRVRKKGPLPAAGRALWQTAAGLVAGAGAIALLTVAYAGPRYVNEFPADYQFLYGPDRPFAPSLARTVAGGALDADSLAGSQSCGTSGCHRQILAEWQPSAHRYAAMDSLFQGVQRVMAEQNGPESTRYCGGCHDPISLFSGAKNLYSEELTGSHGYREGVSCLACHSIRETDLQGNANYVIVQPAAYLWQWAEGGAVKLASDFLIRTYPDQHNQLGKRLFKAPEYCAACHKQFIDQEVNRVGWVQLQNQYDNWKASHWFVEGNPEKTIECRECHMPLVASTDPAAGDDADYNRNPDDGKHRSHRFIAANSLMPKLLELPGWPEQLRLTEAWLKGQFEIPEIEEKWAEGPVVRLALEAPETAAPGEPIKLRVVLTSNKVGHDFPTGPLDIIQSWVEIQMADERGAVVFASGRRDEKNFIEPGSFLFKAEPVDQHGNLIDRHNLWEMVGVRYRRALFPGYSDSVEYLVDCPSAVVPGSAGASSPESRSVRELELPAPAEPGTYRVVATLHYRKVDQFLVNFLLGESSGVTAPVIAMTGDEATIRLQEPARRASSPEPGGTPATRSAG
jgi:hypothetical protein